MHDVLIVGAGSAGCVLANRLSANPDRTVLLLEAGPPDEAREIHIPAGFHRLLGGELDWGYRTDPRDDPAGRARLWPRGRVLGGSSSLNAMIWMRGHPDGYDGWASSGLTGWGWNDVLPYFRRLEDHVLGPGDLHGEGGPVRVERLRDPHVLTRAFLKACAQAGLEANPDFNGSAQEGSGPYHVTQRRGRRWSAVRAFLDPARNRPNLEVRTGTPVRRILFEGGRAVGVEVASGSEGRRETRELRAGEVVLSAGAIGSPHLLLRSGVGPGETLRDAGIPVVRDVPGVGRNLQDHPCVPIGWRTNARTLLRAETPCEVARYYLLRRGMLTSNVAEAGAMIRLDEDAPTPDIQFHFIPGFALDHGHRIPDWEGWMIGVTLVRVASRGRIRPASSDPDDAPVIEAGTFSDDADLERMVRGVELAIEVGAQPAFDRHRRARGSRGPEHPGPEVRGEGALRAFCLEEHQTLYHPVGTCAMGTGAQAVVDPHGRVHGVPGLRVVDASLMPTIPNANTNAPTMMIAEKIAEEGW